MEEDKKERSQLIKSFFCPKLNCVSLALGETEFIFLRNIYSREEKQDDFLRLSIYSDVLLCNVRTYNNGPSPPQSLDPKRAQI